MTDIPFVPPLEVRYGAVEQVSPRIRRIVAENPSRFTYRGTGTYVIGQGKVAVIDPGPVLDTHRLLLGHLGPEKLHGLLQLLSDLRRPEEQELGESYSL